MKSEWLEIIHRKGQWERQNIDNVVWKNKTKKYLLRNSRIPGLVENKRYWYLRSFDRFWGMSYKLYNTGGNHCAVPNQLTCICKHRVDQQFMTSYTDLTVLICTPLAFSRSTPTPSDVVRRGKSLLGIRNTSVGSYPHEPIVRLRLTPTLPSWLFHEMQPIIGRQLLSRTCSVYMPSTFIDCSMTIE